jgi:DNA-binding MarR family transcriptional regulator
MCLVHRVGHVARRLPAPETLSPLYFLFAASQAAGTMLDEALADAPLDSAGYALYSAVRETQPTTPTDLARHLGMPVTTVLDAVAAMLRKEHLVKLRNPRDRRSYLVRLSDDGERIHDDTHRRFAEVDRRLQAHLGERRSAVLATMKELKSASELVLDELRATAAGRDDVAS